MQKKEGTGRAEAVAANLGYHSKGLKQEDPVAAVGEEGKGDAFAGTNDQEGEVRKRALAAPCLLLVSFGFSLSF